MLAFLNLPIISEIVTYGSIALGGLLALFFVKRSITKQGETTQAAADTIVGKNQEVQAYEDARDAQKAAGALPAGGAAAELQRDFNRDTQQARLRSTTSLTRKR